MKQFYIFISFLLLFLGAATVQAKQNQPIFVKLTNVSANELKRLIYLDIDISNVRNKHEVYAYVTRDQFNQLIRTGYQIEQIPDQAKIYADSLWQATQHSPNPLDAYHTYEELSIVLRNLALQYPEICLLESIGKSVLGRELWIMKISDNVTIEENEPEFKYISSMHGDEPVGMELCIYLIHYLLENYNVDSRITRLVNETETWIMPLMNPDGYIAHQRWTANGVDLNRNFPDRIQDPFNSPDGREPETQAVMNFSSKHSFVLSANFHTGALVANYPYDSNETGNNVYTACPDDPLFIELCKTYSSYNPPMWNSPYFSNGITNGADWYVIYGGMQDWNYVWLGCNEVTIELSDNKWPNASLLPSLWEDNRESMISYIEAVHWGVRGMVSDAYTRQPLAATIEVVGIDHNVYNDPDIGDYYRMLLPGTYRFRFSADGYITQEFDSVLVLQDYITDLDVQLVPENGFNITGTIKNRATGSPLFARLVFDGIFQFSTLTDSATGSFKISLPADTYHIKISNDRYVKMIDTVVVSRDLNLNYELLPYIYVLDLDFELNNGDLISADTLWQWGKPGYGPDKAYSGNKLWGTCLQASYADNADAKLTLPGIYLPEVEGLVFTCWHWMDAETDTISPGFAYDGGIVEISSDNGISWTQITSQDGYSHTISSFVELSPFVPGTPVFSGNHVWKEENFDLAPFQGKTVQFRFHFGSDKDISYPFAGWYIDNIAVRYPYIFSGIDCRDNSIPDRFYLSQNYPNPFNHHTTFVYIVNENHDVRISIYNLKGQLVNVLIDKAQKPGRYQISWDGNDYLGHPTTSGLYIVQMECGDQLVTRKALLLR